MHVLQDAALIFKLGFLFCMKRRAFDFLALERPQIQQAQFLLFRALEGLQLRRRLPRPRSSWERKWMIRWPCI